MNLISNITSNFEYLNHDFVGISLNFFGINRFFLHIFLTAIIFIIYYFLGEKLRKLFFKENIKYNFYINFALGYILVGTGLAWLGVFFFLKPVVIGIYLFFIAIIALYPFKFKKTHKLNIHFKNFIIFGVILFVVISFLRLITPEIAEDGYHTDLPILYLSSQTTMHETKEMLHVLPYPQLAEMTYIIPIYFGDKESTRFIHFGFYILIILFLFSITKEKVYFFTKYTPLFFVTTPLVIRYASSQYTDFFMLFNFLLAIMLIGKKMTNKKIILSGLLFGAVISTKVWLIVYTPAILLYIFYLNFKTVTFKKIIQIYIIFIASALTVASVWYIRAFILTGNPLYPLFSRQDYLGVKEVVSPSFWAFIGFNWEMFAIPTLSVFSPLFFISVFFCVLKYKKLKKYVSRSPLFIFFIILLVEQLAIKIYLGRYLFIWYTISLIITSAGLYFALDNNKNKLLKFPLYTLTGGIFLYYFLNTIFILPYGFKWADQNKYLTRVLGRDNVSYYDFDHAFDKWITKRDLVATYGIGSYYYANFSYIDVGYIWDTKGEAFYLLKKNKVTKLLIKGGDFKWFCKELGLTGCSEDKVKLLATYPKDLKKYNLYLIKY